MTKDEILKKLSDYIGEDTSEEAIEILEVVSDALEAMEKDSKVKEMQAEIDEKYAEIDKLHQEVEVLKRKYIERFTAVEGEEEGTEETEEVEEKTTFEELFD